MQTVPDRADGTPPQPKGSVVPAVRLALAPTESQLGQVLVRPKSVLARRQSDLGTVWALSVGFRVRQWFVLATQQMI